jgi:glutamate-ammonia-ligase adenylyltransferase
MQESLARRIVKAPLIADAKSARTRYDAFLERVKQDEDVGASLMDLFEQEPMMADLVLSLASHSPYLWKLASKDIARLSRLVTASPEATLDALLDECDEAARDAEIDEAMLMRRLRLAKQAAGLVIALADLGGVWTVDDVTSALSRFADATLKAALHFALRCEGESGRIDDSVLHDRPSGLVIFALGKHGAGELNYSSDIDIVVLYDADRAPLADGVEPAPFFVRVAKTLVRIIDQHTPDGYVFRVDLRLRPDPGSTPIAISFPSAMAYYETVGQNWERAAMIKARPVAGDVALGEQFIAELSPFIWRKYFDFAAIADIHAMKRQIHAVRGHETIAVSGHDIKLGRGGIREIEFFVQTQQLVFGGRRPMLRGRKTLDMLVALCADGWISSAARDDLSTCYRALRSIEHRLQMVADEQTQRLPSDEKELQRFARFCGFTGLAAFSKYLIKISKQVELHYARLFEEGANLSAGEGSLVFTGTTDDPETIETLRRMGFSSPEVATEIVRGWHFGRRSAVTSPRAREVLTELVPAMLEAFGKSADPDAALNRFDQVLGGIPAAVELFSILREHRPILALFADLLGSAPRLAEIVAHRPHLLDAIIDPAFVEPTPSLNSLIARIASAVGTHEVVEDVLDRLREAGQHEMFLVGVRMLSDVISPAMAGEAYSLIAEALIRIALEDVERRFMIDHGRVAKGRMAVIGMGRLGSREMTATSDLDLIVLYDFDPNGGDSDGLRPLDPVVYYGRLTQRLISALTVPTRRGTLYAVDMRLRPSGNKGPAATQYRGFLDYHRSEEAETWEHLALSRARPLAGDGDFMALVQRDISAILSSKRDATKVMREVGDMRQMIAKEKGDNKPWDMKIARGGLIDIEFIAQTLVLVHAHAMNDLARQSPVECVMVAREHGLLDQADAEQLLNAYSLMRDLMQWQRAMVSGEFDPASADRSFLKRLAHLAGMPDFNRLDHRLKETQQAVRIIFEKVMGMAKA